MDALRVSVFFSCKEVLFLFRVTLLGVIAPVMRGTPLP